MSGPRDVVPVRRTDIVSDVLARDESLVEILVQRAPALAKLRNRAMRRVMARLVTIEQAARLAKVAPELLVQDLNRALGIRTPDDDRSTTVNEASAPEPTDATSSWPMDARVAELDVREELRSGREPFSTIMRAVAELEETAVLRLRTTFEPVPLCAVLNKRGFAFRTEEHAPDDWSTWFWHEQNEASRASDATAPRVEPPATHHDDIGRTTHGELWLDVRNLEPPEPMVRTLAALEHMPTGQTLVHVNVRVPQFLLPMLVERGFTYTIDETRPDEILVRIRRNA